MRYLNLDGNGMGQDSIFTSENGQSDTNPNDIQNISNQDTQNITNPDTHISNSEIQLLKKYCENSTHESSYDKLPSETQILNLQDQLDSTQCNDRRDTIINKEFQKTISKKNNNRVLIHCSLGVSRSASFVILYLMKKFTINFDTVKLKY